MASLADRLMFRGVVLSLVTSLRTARACFIRDSYSSFRFAFCMPFHQDSVRAPRTAKPFELLCRSFRLKDFHILHTGTNIDVGSQTVADYWPMIHMNGTTGSKLV